MEKEKQEIKKVVVYTRVSTEEQAREGYSLENQTYEAVNECKIRGLEVIDICSDEGISGKDIEGRPGLKKALRYIRNKEAQGIVVWKLSRLSRNTADTVNIVDLLKKNEGVLISIKESIDTSVVTGELMAFLLGIIAQNERETIVSNVKGGMEQKARLGQWNGGVVPLGYSLKDKKLIVNEQQREIVEFIFREYLKGNGYKTIAKQLNENGYKTAKGKEFSGNSVKGILMNVTYKGKIRWGKLKNWSYLDDDRRRKRQYNENVIEVDGVHEAIIDPQTFDKVQEMIENNPRHNVKQFTGDHMLSGVLRCPKCGYGMSAQRMTSKGKEYWYYGCNQYHNKKAGCRAHLIRKDKIEEEFCDIFERIVNEENFRNKILRGLNDTQEQVESLLKVSKRKKDEADNLKSKQNKLIDELIEGDEGYKKIIRGRIQEVSDQINNVENQIREIEENIIKFQAQTINTEEVSKILQSIGKAFKLMPEVNQKEIVRKLIYQIQVEEKHIKSIHFNFELGFPKWCDKQNPTTNNGDRFLDEWKVSVK